MRFLFVLGFARRGRMDGRFFFLRYYYDSSGRMYRRGCGGSNYAVYLGSKR